MDKIILQIDGVEWQGWTSLEVVQQIDGFVSSFALGLVDRWSKDSSALPISAGLACEVLFNADSVLQGYIDSSNPFFTCSDHGISVSGRSATADMVDCSAVHSPGHWKGLNILQLAQILAKPFGLAVRADAELGEPFASFKLEQGETAFDALHRALRQRELLALPEPGGFVLAKIGAKKASTSIEQGKNAIDPSATYDLKDRFSEYLVQGQQQSTDSVWGEGASAVKASAKDSNIKRHRPLIIRAENQVNSRTAQKRADWECTVRAAKSVTVSCSVMGYRMADGELWQPNMLVPVKLPYLGIDGDLLVSKVTFSRSMAGGSVTKLELKDPQSFLPAPEKAKKTDGASDSPDNWDSMSVAPEGDLQGQSQASATASISQIKEGEL